MGDPEALCAFCAHPITSAYEGVGRVGGSLVHSGCFVGARERPWPTEPPSASPGPVRRLVDWIRRRPALDRPLLDR